jgi:hypothetical protein
VGGSLREKGAQLQGHHRDVSDDHGTSLGASAFQTATLLQTAERDNKDRLELLFAIYNSQMQSVRDRVTRLTWAMAQPLCTDESKHDLMAMYLATFKETKELEDKMAALDQELRDIPKKRGSTAFDVLTERAQKSARRPDPYIPHVLSSPSSSASTEVTGTAPQPARSRLPPSSCAGSPRGTSGHGDVGSEQREAVI